jgi:hypothetical protein
MNAMAPPKRNKFPYGIEYKTAVEIMANKRGLKSGPMGAVRALLSFLNKETGHAYPAKATLAARIGGGERTATRHCRTLESMGIIEAVAYRNGGHGRSTVWKFTAPAWAKPEHYKGANLAGYQDINPAKLSNNPAKLADQPDKNLIRTGDIDTSGDVKGVGAANLYPKWDGVEPYGQYLSNMKHCKKEALRAAGD